MILRQPGSNWGVPSETCTEPTGRCSRCT